MTRTESSTTGTAPATTDTLMLDMLEWIGRGGRPYAEVLDAWRTSCPRLPVWEEANNRGFLARSGGFVSISAAGAAHLDTHRPRAQS